VTVWYGMYQVTTNETRGQRRLINNSLLTTVCNEGVKNSGSTSVVLNINGLVMRRWPLLEMQQCP